MPDAEKSRVRPGPKAKPAGEAKTERLDLRLKPADKEWLKTQPGGANQWVEDRIQEARQAEESAKT